MLLQSFLTSAPDVDEQSDDSGREPSAPNKQALGRSHSRSGLFLISDIDLQEGGTVVCTATGLNSGVRSPVNARDFFLP